MPLVAGTRLGHYHVLSPIGAGAMGEVYAALDLRLGRQVALKVLPARVTIDPEKVRRFTMEARAASALNHPNIVTIHEIGQSADGPFIAMELVHGRTLRLLTGEPAPIEVIVRIGRQIAEALRVAHDAGITHRDIKPENVMVRDDGYVKVLDFGLASLAPEGIARARIDTMAETAPGLLVGTVRYMSPEQARQQPVTGAADVFALGVVLYELSTGRWPFDGDTPVSVLHHLLSDPPVSPARLRLDLPLWLDALILRMLEKDSRERPSAREVEAQLAVAQAMPASAPVNRRPPVKRHTVGRTKERERLRDAFEAAAAGRGLVVSVSGEPGAGKTTVVEAFLGDLIAAGIPCRIARGRCSERLAGTEAYLPWLEALEELIRGGGESAARLAQTLALTWYQQIAPAAPGTTGTPRHERAPSQERLKRELAALLKELSRRQPLVLFFDDLHWADGSTVDMLAFLADRLDSTRLLVVATYRPSDLLIANHPFVRLKQGLVAHGVNRDLPLDFLSREDIAEYLALEFPSNQFPPDLAARLHARTEGSPLFMADLVQYLRARQVITEEDGRWVLRQPLGEVDRDLPESTRAMIDRKVAQLGDTDRRLLVAASVQGNEFDAAVVAEVVEIDAAEVEERLETLERVHAFVRRLGQREFPDRTVTLRYRFMHVLYQNSLFASLQPARRAQWAGAMAAALERHWGDQSAAIANQLALLFESAREFARAADYFRLAAQHAAALFASQEAVVLARLALAMIEAMPPGRDRRERELSVQIVLGNALMATRGYAAPEVEATYTRAEALCREIGETPHALPVLFGVFGYQVVRANLRTALDVGVEFLRRTERQPGPSVLIGHRLAGGASLYLGDLTTARRHLAEATRLYDRALHRPLTWLYGQEPGTVVFSLLAMADWLLGYPDRALASSEEALRIGREISHAHTHAQLLTFTAMHHQLRRDWSRVGELARALADLAAEQGMPFWSAAALPLRASVLTAQGRAPEAVADLQRGIETMKALGAELFRPYSLYLLADALGQAGDVAGALEALDRADLTMQQHDERWWEPEQLRLRGELLARLGVDRRPEADACVWRAVEIARAREAKSLELRAVTSLARMRAQTERRDEARAQLARTYGWFAEGLESADLSDAKGALAGL